MTRSFLRVEGAIPFLLIAFINTFVDIGHKTIILNAIYSASTPQQFTVLSSVISTFFLLPYVLLFTPSGFISDRFSKTQVLRLTALIAVPLMMLMTVCYFQGWFWLAMVMTLLLAVQSTFNSPAKYGYIKEAFGKEEIARANGYLQALVILAIVLAQTVFTFVAGHYLQGSSMTRYENLVAMAPIGYSLVALALLEYALTWRLPALKAADPSGSYDWRAYFRLQYLRQYLKMTMQHRVILTCIVGLSLFYAINQELLAVYSAYLKEYTDVSDFFSLSSIGIGGIGILLGSLYVGQISHGFIETGAIPVACIGLSVGLFLLTHLTSSWSIGIVLLLYGIFGGMMIVPLNALIQFHANKGALGRVIAGNHFWQNIAMLLYLLVGLLLSVIGIPLLLQMHMMLVIAIIGTVGACILLPQSLVRFALYFVLSRFYRVQVTGLNHLPANEGALLLGNHVTFIDWAILQIACPRQIRFVIDRSFYQKWYLKYILRGYQVIPISRSASRDAMQAIAEALEQGDLVCLFPEGYLSRNGQIGHFFPGFEKALSQCPAPVIPFYLCGLWGTRTSAGNKRMPLSFPKLRCRRVSVSYGEPLAADIDANQLKKKVFELSIHAWQSYSEILQPIAVEWLYQAKKLGSEFAMAEAGGKELSNTMLIAAVMRIRKILRSKLGSEQRVGIVLPPSIGGIVTNLALFCLGRTVVNLNYTHDPQTIKASMAEAGVTTVISARIFLATLKRKGYDLTAALQGSQVVYLDDHKGPLSVAALVKNALLVRLTPAFILKRMLVTRQSLDDTAMILFSSGSEGVPKGVMLSHRNILSNAKQISEVFNIMDSDVILASLPLFHSFGMTVGVILPLLEGAPIVTCPDPTDALTIGKTVFSYNATIMFGTSTLFRLYERNSRIHAKMFASIRTVIAGAEKLSDTVRSAFREKFSLEILEGYGATELSPVASVNLEDVLTREDWKIHTYHKRGTVGLPLPGSAVRIVDPETLEELPLGESGLILVGGVQVMQGYLNQPESEAIVTLDNIRWYKTGDKGYLDQEGFLTIIDRYARFAKIGGEMISLSAVEDSILQQAPEGTQLLAVAVPSPQKGEKIIVIYQQDTIDAPSLQAAIQASDLSNMAKPSRCQPMEALPTMANGKRDFAAAKRWVLDLEGE